MNPEANEHDANLLPSVGEPKGRFEYPRFITSELATKIFERGVADRHQYKFHGAKIAAIGVVIEVALFFVAVTFRIDLGVLFAIAVGVVLASVYSVAILKSSKVDKAFRLRRFDVVSALLPDAFRFSMLCLPFTFFQYTSLSGHLFNVLLLEGRLTELEALGLYRWGMAGEKQTPDGVPKSAYLASTLALSYMLQNRFVEAERIFKDVASKKTAKDFRAAILNNLAYTLVRSGRSAEAQGILQEAFAITGVDKKTPVTTRLKMVTAMVAVELNELDTAEREIQFASEYASACKLPAEISAACEVILASVRAKQKRYEEAKLHFKNAVDVIESGDNPDYITLANTYNEYASLLIEIGEKELAEKVLDRAQSVRDFYVGRETDATNLIAARLGEKVDLLYGVNLTALGVRTKYLNFAGPADEIRADPV